MKIVFDHQIFSTQHYGGISRYFREVAVRLAAKADTRVSVVAPFHINEYLRHDANPGFGGPYFGYHFRYADEIRSRAQQYLLPRLYARHRDADIVHETYHSNTAFGTGRARVTTVYDMIYELYPQYYPDAAQVTQAKRAAVARCDHVICISEATRQDLIRIFGVASERTSVIHLACDLALPGAEPVPVTPVSEARPYLLFVGARRHYKNFDRLAQAFAASAVLRNGFDLVAFGGRPFSQDESALFRQLGIAERLRYVSGDDAVLAAHYRGAAVFVMSSLCEGFGIPPLEAMSSDCPVACSNTSCIPEVVGDAAAYFDPMSVDSIRATLEQVVGSEELRMELVARGRERLKAFSWQRCADETAQVYARLLRQQF